MNKTLHKILLIVLLVISTPTSAEPKWIISREVEIICLTKLGIIDWLFTQGYNLPISERLKQWDNGYKILNNFFPDLFVHTTKVDVERIIRDMERKKEELITEEQRNEYMRKEMSWCIYYKH